jgi:hypothetical protein
VECKREIKIKESKHLEMELRAEHLPGYGSPPVCGTGEHHKKSKPKPKKQSFFSKCRN